MFTAKGELYTFGSGHDSALGHMTDTNETIPRAVDALSGVPVSQVAVGPSHMLAVARTSLPGPTSLGGMLVLTRGIVWFVCVPV